MRRHLAALAAAIVATLVFAAVALGITSAELEPRASEWQGKTCDASLLASKKAKANQEIALCYALGKVQEDSAAIASMQAQLAKLESTSPEDFTTSITDYALGDGAFVETELPSPGSHTHLAVSHEGTALWTLEVSDDKTNWIPIEVSGNPIETAVTGKYYRLRAEGTQKGVVEVTAIGAYSD